MTKEQVWENGQCVGGFPQYWFPDEKDSNEGYVRVLFQHETFYIRAKKEIRNESQDKRRLQKEESAKTNNRKGSSSQREEA